jgi:hypothetical protein
MSGRRLDVTATQAVSSMLAALTGAIAASGLGIAGTIIGAAFMSLAGTVGAAIYKHYLGRSKEKLREAATSLAPKAATHPAAAAVLRHSLRLDPELTARLRPDGQAVVETRADPPGADHEQPAALADTRVETAVAGPARHARATTGAPSAFTRDDSAAAAVAANIAAAVLGDRGTLGHESLGYTAAEHPVTDPDGGAAGRDRPPGGGAGSRSPARRRRRWLAMAGAVLATFVVAMSAVTAVEAIAGKPLESLIWHKSGSGTTIGSVVENRPSSRATTTPGTSPAPSQSPSARPSSISPSPSTTSPAPSTSVSPSLQTSPSPTSSPSGSTGTSAAPSAPATSPAAG